MNISNEEKRILLRLARNSIKSLFQKIDPSEIAVKDHPILNTHKGAFVTLTIDNRLRGCIGYITSNSPLDQTVEDAAQLMVEKKIKKLPVVENDKVVGIITATDLISIQPKLIEALAKLLLFTEKKPIAG